MSLLFLRLLYPNSQMGTFCVGVAPRDGQLSRAYFGSLGVTISGQHADLRGKPFCSSLKEALNSGKAAATWPCTPVSVIPDSLASPLGRSLSQC